MLLIVFLNKTIPGEAKREKKCALYSNNKKLTLPIGFPVEIFSTKIVQKLRKYLLTFRVKIARNFDVFAH